jgi:hypothetical protein
MGREDVAMICFRSKRRSVEDQAGLERVDSSDKRKKLRQGGGTIVAVSSQDALHSRVLR